MINFQVIFTDGNCYCGRKPEKVYLLKVFQSINYSVKCNSTKFIYGFPAFLLLPTKGNFGCALAIFLFTSHSPYRGLCLVRQALLQVCGTKMGKNKKWMETML